MNLTGPLLPRHRTTKRDERWRPFVLGILTLMAVVLQFFLPLVTTYLSYVQLPLLFTIHVALSRRSPVGALLYGGAVGLLEDAVFNRPLGVYGIVKTLVGFFAANAGMRMDAENPAIRVLLSFVFYFLHRLVQIRIELWPNGVYFFHLIALKRARQLLERHVYAHFQLLRRRNFIG